MICHIKDEDHIKQFRKTIEIQEIKKRLNSDAFFIPVFTTFYILILPEILVPD